MRELHLFVVFHLHDLVRGGVFVPGAGEQEEEEGVEHRDRNHFELLQAAREDIQRVRV